MTNEMNSLLNFIRSHKTNWQGLLKKKPYNLKAIKPFELHPNWYILVYNLVESDMKNPIVRACRGPVIEVDGDNVKCICQAYDKFFNWNDPNSAMANIDWASARLYDKVDGSILKMFKYKGVDYWISNGAPGIFTPLTYKTDEIKTYQQLLAKALGCSYDGDKPEFHCDCEWVKHVPDGWTLMFELTSPQNRIIVKYNEDKIWFHGARDENGNEMFPEVAVAAIGLPYEIPKMYNGVKSIDEAFNNILKDMNGLEKEGLVVCDKNFNRIKVKCESYLQMKFIRDTAESPEAIWRIVANEEFDDLLEKAPELKDKINDAVAKWSKFCKAAKSTCAYAVDVFENDFRQNRKKYALWVQKEVKSSWASTYFTSIDKGADEAFNQLRKKLIDDPKGYDRYVRMFDEL